MHKLLAMTVVFSYLIYYTIKIHNIIFNGSVCQHALLASNFDSYCVYMHTLR